MTAAVLRSVPSLAFLAALAACPAVPVPEQAGASRDTVPGATADSIVLERTRCFGTCPAYRLRLAGTGHVVFQSRDPDAAGRTAADSVSPAAVAALVGEAEALGFFGLPDVTAEDRSLCPARATDQPTATVTIYRPAGEKRVEDYHGCFVTTDRSVVPVIGRLRTFEAAIDSAADVARWIR